MLYRNASNGLKSVFSAEIFELFGTFIFAVVADSSMNDIIKLIGAIVSVILLIMALINSVKGLRLAAEDDAGFRTAYEFTIGLLTVEMLYIILGVLARWIQFFDRFALSNSLVSLFSLLSNVFVAYGIRNLFNRMEDKKNAGFANTVAILTIIGGILDVAYAFISVPLMDLPNPAALLSVSAGYVVFNLTVFILYLVLLRKGIKRFA